MKTFWSFSKSYAFLIFVSIFLMLLELVSELFQPFIMSKIIDDGIVASDFNLVVVWGILLVASSIFMFAMGIVSSFYSSYVSQYIGYDIRKKLIETIQGFTYSVFSKFSEASLMTRMTNDVVQIQNMVFMGTRIALKAPLLVIGNLVMAFIINPYLALFLLFALPFIIGFLAFALKKNFKLFKQVQAKLDQVNSSIQQSLMGVRLIRIFVRSNYENDKFEKDSRALKQKTISTLMLAELTTPVVMLIVNVAVLLIIWAGHRAIFISDSATIGEVVAVTNYAMRVSGALSMLSWIVMSVSRVAASMERIEEVLETNTAYEDIYSTDTKNIAGKIAFKDVSFKYEGSQAQTLAQLNFTIKKGEMVALMGATGSGKTSVLQLISRLHEKSAGDITLDDQSQDNYELTTLRQSIGYVPQDILLFSGTIADNIRYGKKEASLEDVIEAAKMAQIHETIVSFPDGYNTVIGQKGVNLSGGQKQRISIARALVRKPSILLLDDCTSALDVQTENALLSEIRKLSCTVLLVTQKMSSTVVADRIIILDEGRIIADGTHHELLEQSQLYQRIYESQDYTRRSGQWTAQLENVTP